MRWLIIITSFLMYAGFSLSVGWANPATLPNHPGHPMSDMKDPVNGMSLANDPGRSLYTGSIALDKAAVSHDQSSLQNSPNFYSVEGAGMLPKEKGYPDYKIDPPVKEATKLNK